MCRVHMCVVMCTYICVCAEAICRHWCPALIDPLPYSLEKGAFLEPGACLLPTVVILGGYLSKLQNLLVSIPHSAGYSCAYGCDLLFPPHRAVSPALQVCFDC